MLTEKEKLNRLDVEFIGEMEIVDNSVNGILTNEFIKIVDSKYDYIGPNGLLLKRTGIVTFKVFQMTREQSYDLDEMLLQ